MDSQTLEDFEIIQDALSVAGNKVQFTQFLRPDGRRRSITMTVDEPFANMAKELTKAGWAFEIELLANGVVNMDCCDAEQQLASQLVQNGPDVPKTVETLIMHAHAQWALLGRPKAER